MAGRKRRSSRDASKRREAPSSGGGGASLSRQNPSIDDSRIVHRLHHSPSSSSASAVVRVLPPSALEDRIAVNHRQIQSLLVDNQRLASTHVALKQDLTATQQELRHLSSSVANVKAERDIEVRQIYEKSLKMDAEVRAVEAMSSDLVQVRTDIQELDAARKDLASQLQAIESEIARVRAESQQVTAIKADIEAMRHEIQRGRNAIEYEKKTYARNLEHRETMDKNMIIMAREVEKLRVELSNAEKRARAAVNVAEAANPSHYDNPEMAYGGIAYSDSYSKHQIQSGANAHPQFASGAALQHPYDMQHTHVHR